MSGLTRFTDVRADTRNATFKVYDTRDASAFDHLLVLLHGCGGTSQTFGAMVSSLPPTVRVVAYDSRGHGGTVCDRIEDEQDMSIDTLVTDGKAVLESVLTPDQAFVLCGHSMGGAVATRLALAFSGQCRGLIMIDAVEGIAIKSLSAGEKHAAQIPQRFRTVDDAVRYATTTSHHGHFSASISVPDQLIPHPDGGFTWRTNIFSTAPFWRGWFTGLSSDFLSFTGTKLLILAGVENLDTPLSAGHMQGKYQLVVLANVRAGHFVQEDAPGQTATVIVTFLNRIKAKDAASRPGGLSAQEVIALNAKLKRGEV